MKTSKLQLQTETLRTLTTTDLDDAHGGTGASVIKFSKRYCVDIVTVAPAAYDATKKVLNANSDATPHGPRPHSKGY